MNCIIFYLIAIIDNEKLEFTTHNNPILSRKGWNPRRCTSFDLALFTAKNGEPRGFQLTSNIPDHDTWLSIVKTVPNCPPTRIIK